MASRQGSTPEALRIALVGKTGCGKSSTANTILGENKFVAKPFGKSVTKICGKAETNVDGRCVAVVDTPGLFDTSLSNKKTMIETSKCISLLCPGPHAFLLLLRIGRFTEEEQRAVECIKKTFGEDAEKYIMIIFTGGDELEKHDASIEEFIDNSEDSLKKLVSDCGNRFHVFNNNREKKDRTQVQELLRKIDDMVKKNGGSHYTSKMFQEAEEAIQKEQRRILEEKQQEIQKQEEQIRRKYQQEMEKVLQEAKQKQDKEKREMEKQLKEMKEKIKDEQKQRELEQREREKQKEREREMERKREEQQREMERKRAEDIQRLNDQHEKNARREAETDNPFLRLIGPLAEGLVQGVVSLVKNLFE